MIRGYGEEAVEVEGGLYHVITQGYQASYLWVHRPLAAETTQKRQKADTKLVFAKQHVAKEYRARTAELQDRPRFLASPGHLVHGALDEQRSISDSLTIRFKN